MIINMQYVSQRVVAFAKVAKCEVRFQRAVIGIESRKGGH